MPAPSPIALPFSPQSLIQVLTWGTNPEKSPHSHKQIAEWCDRFWCKYMDIDAPHEIEQLLPVLTDVETQWDLYLANTFTLEYLQTHDCENVQLPSKWFQDWLQQVQSK